MRAPAANYACWADQRANAARWHAAMSQKGPFARRQRGCRKRGDSHRFRRCKSRREINVSILDGEPSFASGLAGRRDFDASPLTQHRSAAVPIVGTSLAGRKTTESPGLRVGNTIFRGDKRANGVIVEPTAGHRIRAIAVGAATRPRTTTSLLTAINLPGHETAHAACAAIQSVGLQIDAFEPASWTRARLQPLSPRALVMPRDLRCGGRQRLGGPGRSALPGCCCARRWAGAESSCSAGSGHDRYRHPASGRGSPDPPRVACTKNAPKWCYRAPNTYSIMTIAPDLTCAGVQRGSGPWAVA
jgi:hypothetical protein